MTTFNANRIKKIRKRANSTLIEALSWTRAWAFNDAPETPGAVPALTGTTSGDLTLVGSYEKGHGTSTLYPEAIGESRLNQAVRLTGVTSRFGGAYGTSSNVRMRMMFRVPEIDGDYPIFSWGTTTDDIRVRRLRQARGRIEVTRRVSNTVEYEETFDVGDEWVLLDISLAANGSDTDIFVGCNGQTDSQTLTSVSYTGFASDIDIGSNFAANRPGYIDFLFFGFLEGSVWTASDHSRAWRDSGLDLLRAPPHDFVRLGEENSLEISAATVNNVLNGSNQALVSFWGRSSGTKSDRIVAGRSDQLVVRSGENGSSADSVFALRSRNLIDAYDWNFYSWDFSGNFNVDGDLDPYTGGVTLTNTNSTKDSTQGVSTGALVPDSINTPSITRLDDSTTSGGDYWTLDGELNTIEDDLHVRIIMKRPNASGHILYMGDFGVSGGDDNYLWMRYNHNANPDNRYIQWSIYTENSPFSRFAYIGDADWLLIDAWYRRNPTDGSIISGIYVNGPDQYNNVNPTLNGESNNTADQFHPITGDGFDLFHFNNGSIIDTDVLFFGMKDWDGMDEATHEADWEASGLAPNIFETFTWDFSWLGKNAPNGTDITTNIPAETGGSDMITGNSGNGQSDGPGTYSSNLSTDGLRQGGIGNDNIDEAIQPSFDWRAYAGSVTGLTGATGYHLRALIRLEGFLGSAQPDILTIGDADGNETFWMYIRKVQDTPNDDALYRINARTDLNLINSGLTWVSGFTPGQWILVDAWIGEVGPNVEMKIFANGVESSTITTSNRSLPTVANEIFFSDSGFAPLGMPWLFFGVRQAPTPLTLSEHLRDANRVGARVGGGDVGVQSEHPWSDGQWHHYSYLYSNKIPMGIWVDGNKTYDSNVGPSVPSSLNPSSSNFLVGQDIIDMAQLQIWGDTKEISQRDLTGLYIAQNFKDNIGFYRHTSPDSSQRGDLFYPLNSTTGFTVNGTPRVLTDNVPDLTDAYTWEHAWKFDEISNVRRDYLDPKAPYAYLQFSAGASYQVSGPIILDNLETLTFEFWYRSSTLPSTTSPKNGLERIYGRWNGPQVMKENNGGSPFFRFYVENAVAVRTTAAVPELTDGNWHHYIASFRGGSSPEVSIFIDGQSRAHSFVVGSSLPSNTGSGSNFQVGSDFDNRANSDEVQAFDMTLASMYQLYIGTATEARRIFYNRELRTESPISKGTVYYYEDVSLRFRGILSAPRTTALTGTVTAVTTDQITNVGTGSVSLNLNRGRSFPDQGIGGFGENALGRVTRSVGTNAGSFAYSPSYWQEDSNLETLAPVHIRLILKHKFPNDNQSKVIFRYGLGGDYFQLSSIRRNSRFDYSFLVTRNNSLYLSLIHAQTSGVFEDDSWLLIDVNFGAVDSETAFLQAYVNGLAVGAEVNLPYEEIDVGGVLINNDLEGADNAASDCIFAGVRTAEFSFNEHLNDWNKFTPRSVLFSGGRFRFPYAWDFTKEWELPMYRNAPTNFLPTDVSSLETWFDFDDNTNLTRNNAYDITGVTDKGTAAVTATVTGTILDSYWNTIRRAGVIESGVDITFTPDMANYNELWIACVVDTRRQGGDNFLDDANSNLRAHIPLDTNDRISFRASSVGGFSESPADYDEREYRLVIVYRHSVTDNERYLYINGSEVDSDTSPTSGVLSSDITISTSGSDGVQIGDIMFGSGAFTDEDRQNIEGYLAWKWGLEHELPSSHPFASDLTITSWYDFSQQESLNYDAFSRITEVKDLSGNGNTLEDSSTSPSYVDFEGKKGADFNGVTGNAFTGNPFGDDPTLDEIWTFAVLNTGPADNHSLFTRDPTTTGVDLNFGDALGRATVTVGNNSLVSANSSIPANTLALAYWRNSSAEGFQEIRLDGAQIATDTSAGTGSITNTIIVGNDMDKTVGEIISGTGPMPTHRRQMIEGYLAHKWGISLPSGHPYENCPPAPLKAYQGDIDLHLGQGSAELRGPITDDRASGRNGSVYDLAFNQSDLGAGRTRYLELGPGSSNGSGLYAVDSRLNFQSGVHARLLFQANAAPSTDMNLIHISSDANPSLRVYRNGTNGNYIAEYTNASASTFTATVPAASAPATGQWSLLDVWIEVDDSGEGMTLNIVLNTIAITTTLASEEFTGFGGIELQVGDTTATAPIEEIGLIFLGIREGRQSYLIERGNSLGRNAISSQYRDSYNWQVAYSGELADDTNWPPLTTGRGPTLTASGTSGYARNTGGMTPDDVGKKRVNKAVERLSGSSHSSTTGHDVFDTSTPIHIRTIVKPANNSSGSVWEFVQPDQTGINHRFQLRQVGTSNLEFYYSGFRTWPVTSSTLGSGNLDVTLVSGHNVQVGDTIITRNLVNNITAEATVSAVSGNVVTAPLSGTEATNGSGYLYITSGSTVSDSVLISGVKFNEWNLIDIVWVPNNTAGDVDIYIHINEQAQQSSLNSILIHPEVTEPSETNHNNIGIGLMCETDGTAPDVGTELLFVGWREIITANDMTSATARGDFSSSGIGSEMLSSPEHNSHYNRSKL